MKGVFTFRLRWVLSLAFLQLTVFAQPDYTFTNGVHESGTALQPGSVYKFANVKGGTDARITVLGFTGGVTLSSIDENWTGFDEAFQPFIQVDPNANGYVEFKIDFYQAGTMNLKQQGVVPVTCIDVDGVEYDDGILYEHDQIEFLPGYYDYMLTGGNLQVLSLLGWISIKNTSGFSYSGIDTIAKDVMATVMNRNTSGFKLRIGAVNTSTTESEVRYRSVYFKRFNYGHQEPLAQKTILNLSGDRKRSGNELRVTLGSGAGEYHRMIVERSSRSGSAFSAIGTLTISNHAEAAQSLTYWDGSAGNGTGFYYRVRLVNDQTGKEEISNILLIKDPEAGDDLKLVNSITQAANPSLLVRSVKVADALVRITDLSGRMLYSGRVRLNAGSNNITLNPLNCSLSYAIVSIETGELRKATKILLQ